MNIGIVTTWFERGAAYVSRAYMESLSRKHNVFIYARGGEKYAKGDPKWDKSYVTWGKPVPGKPYMYIDPKEFQEWVRQNRIKVVIFNEQHSWETILDALKLDITIGAYVDYYTPETVPFFWLYDFLLCNTKRHYSVFEDHPQVLYIPWGTDLEVFKPRHMAGSGDSVTFFHSCGASPERKGTDILVRAFQHLKGNTKLVIHSQWALSKLASSYRTPEERDRINRMVSIITRDPRIKLIEGEVGAPGLYHLGDVYVYPTRLEGIGLTIAEALACGLPVITTNAPPMNEFVVHDLNGRLVEAAKYERRSDNYYWPQSICSEAALTEAMQFYVDNIDALEHYKQRAREYAEANLDWQKNSCDLLELIENISYDRKRIDYRLPRAVARYERSRYPHRPFHKCVKSILRKAGLGRVTRLLKSLLALSLRKVVE